MTGVVEEIGEKLLWRMFPEDPQSTGITQALLIALFHSLASCFPDLKAASK